jgi:hypothetical protein
LSLGICNPPKGYLSRRNAVGAAFARCDLCKCIVASASAVRNRTLKCQQCSDHHLSNSGFDEDARPAFIRYRVKPLWRRQMWVMILVSVAIADPPHSKFSPAFHSAEFSTRESCESARVALDKSFGAHISKLNQVIESQATVGQARPYERLLFYSLCTPK